MNKKLIITSVMFVCIIIVLFFILRADNVSKNQNLIINPSFEEGNKSWDWLDWSDSWAAFEIVTNKSHSGNNSALLRMSSLKENRSTVVWGITQEIIVTSEFPNLLEGYYFVENWSRGTEKQYIQVVIIDLNKTVLGGKS